MGKIYMCPLLIFLMKKSLLLKSKRNTSIVFFFYKGNTFFAKNTYGLMRLFLQRTLIKS